MKTYIDFGFVLLTILFLFWTILPFVKAYKTLKIEPLQGKLLLYKVIGLLVIWTLLISLLSLSGFFSDFSRLPPRPLIMIVTPMVLLFFLMKNALFQRLLTAIPKRKLMQLQVFRVVVEILLFFLFLENLLPFHMTFEGYNFDILVGITGPLFAWICFGSNRNNIRLAKIWNYLGLLLLLNIVVIAVLSMPTPIRQFMNEPANTIVATFPIVWLPSLLVPMAYYLHVFSLYQLKND